VQRDRRLECVYYDRRCRLPKMNAQMRIFKNYFCKVTDDQ
jgi:hypothetical protein